jgi:hypothetical protein
MRRARRLLEMNDFRVVGWAIDTFFRGHRMAAKVLQTEIELHHGPPHEEVIEQLRNGTPQRG